MKTKFTNTRVIRVGSQVLHRGGFGRDSQSVAGVIAIEQTKHHREKYGAEVGEVSMGDNYVLTLDNGHWCYSDQVDGVLTATPLESAT
jgi:hypothetical protein